MQEFEYITPETIDEACQALLEEGSRPVAGATDVLPQMRRGRLTARRLVDLSQLEGLNFIARENGRLSLGALVTYQELIEHPGLLKSAPALVQAAASVGCLQTRNRGTLGGNLGNASPAGDSLPPLLVMNAVVRLRSVKTERDLPLADFLVAPGVTALKPGEIIQQVDLEALANDSQAIFLKLGSRQGMAVSIVSAACFVRCDGNGVLREARLALGAVAPAAMRCPRAESFLTGQRLDKRTAVEAGRIASQECSPIDDVRGSAAYRRHVVQVLVKRGLLALLNEVEG